MTLVLADGTIANAGGKVVKNVAGYDLGRLVCGSEGRLAFIARVSLRLHPLPKAAVTLVVQTEDASSIVTTLLRSQLEPSALDVLHPGRVAVLFEGSPRAVEAQVAAAKTIVGGDEAESQVWEESRRRQDAARGRVRFAPGDLARTVEGLSKAVVRPAAGVAYVQEEIPSGSEPQGPDDPLHRLRERIRRAFDPAGTLAP